MSSASKKIHTFEDFVNVHGLLLTASGLPSSLHKALFQKLSTETFDGGNYFQIEPCEDGRQRRLLFTKEFMGKESNVFLVDHAWTFRLGDAYKQLLEVPGLAERMASLMCVDTDLNDDVEVEGIQGDNSHENTAKMSIAEMIESELCKAKENNDTARWLELEELDIEDNVLLSLDLPSKFPDLLALSLFGNKLKNEDVVIKEVAKFKHLKALWLNNNPVLETDDRSLAEKILQECPTLEILNSSFTRNFGAWALGFCGDLYDNHNPGNTPESNHLLQAVTSLDLSNRSIHNLLNKEFSPAEMPSLSCLNLRGNPLEENSSNDLLQVLKGFPSLSSLEVGIPGPLGESSVALLESLPNLSVINGVSTTKILEAGKHVIDSSLQPRLPEWKPEDLLADRIINAMWLYMMTYRLANEEKIDETNVWYVMDELGSSLRHSDEPSFMVAPFLFMPEGNLESAVRS